MQFNLWNEKPRFVSRWQWFIACLIGLAGELVDFAFVIEQVPKVYDSVTCGKFSKPNHRAETIIDAAYDCTQRWIDDAIKEEREIASHGGFASEPREAKP